VAQWATGLTVGHPTGAAVKLLVESAGLIGFEVGADLVSSHFSRIGRGMVVTVTFKERLVSQWQRVMEARHS
jgi:hypothetical protein